MKTIKRSKLMKMLGAVCCVSNLESSRSGRGVANQFEIDYENGSAFQSYRSLIAVRCNGNLYLTDRHDYSATTCKYANEWVGYTAAERRKMLENEEAILIVS